MQTHIFNILWTEFEHTGSTWHLKRRVEDHRH